jgi:ribonuclease HII
MHLLVEFVSRTTFRQFNCEFLIFNFRLKLLPFLRENTLEAGLDEAGRGCLAGPVFAAAVILPPDFDNDMLNDSKQLSEKKRIQLRELIEKQALAWAVALATPAEIDRINIANASYLAMNRAVEQLKLQPEWLLVDGKYFKKSHTIPHQCIIKGDGKFAPIAAASILAKTYRDDYMKALATQYPHYAWDINKGYPTAVHRAALNEFGASIEHRQSFRLIYE